MAIQALNLHDTKKISFPGDTVDPTIWEIGAVDSRVFGKLKDRALVVGVDPNNPSGDADVKMSRNGLAFEVVQFGLRGFDNFVNVNGQVKFSTEKMVIGAKSYDVVSSDILRTVPGDVLQWLHQQIVTLNELSDDEGNV